MCQLILSNLHDSQLNKLAVTTMIQLGASAGNTHGTGVFFLNGKGEGKLWKTAMSGDSIINLGRMINGAVQQSSNPVLAHVRDASKGINVVDENAHPFEGKRFILAHNGRLYDESEDAWSSYDSKTVISDSKKFLEFLEKIAEKNPKAPILDIANEAMSHFSGKFALLFIDKLTGKHYVARGNTADLHMVKIYKDVTRSTNDKGEEVFEGKDQIGFLVMTKKETLSNSVSLLNQTFQVISKGYFNDGDSLVELPKETLFEVTDLDLLPIGEMRENSTQWSTPASKNFASTTPSKQKSSNPLSTDPLWTHIVEIAKWAEKHFLSVKDVDVIFESTVGVPISSTTEEEIKWFVFNIIPALTASNKMRKKIANAKGFSQCIFPNLYLEGMKFPWMLNDDKFLTSEFIPHLIKKNKSH